MAVLDLASSVFSSYWVVHLESSLHRFISHGDQLRGERSKQGSSTIRQIS